MEKERFITIDELCALTGFKKAYIYQLTFARAIPHYKPTGKKLFFKVSEINKWIETCKIKADYEE